MTPPLPPNITVPRPPDLQPSPQSSTQNTHAIMSWPLRVLLIDNFDSYTFNVYQLLCQLLPTPPIVIRNSSSIASWSDLLSSPSLLGLNIDAVVISPGPGSPDVPRDFGICADILKHATSIPILGVCLGHQGLGHVHGAQVVRAPEVMHGRTSPIAHVGQDVFGGIPSPFEVVRYHSLIVHEDSLPPCLVPTAWTTDALTGRQLVMGMRHRDHPHFGVQFHPESICSQHGLQLMENFCRIALDHALANRPDLDDDMSRFGLNNPELSRAWLRLMDEYSVVPSAHVPRSLGSLDLVGERGNQSSPLIVRLQAIESGWHDPELVFDALFAQAEHPVWLDSARVQGSTRWSYMGSLSSTGFSLTYSGTTKQLVQSTLGGPATKVTLSPEITLFDELNHLMSTRLHIDRSTCLVVNRPCGESREDMLPPFLGGLAGYIGYEMKAETLHIPPLPTSSSFPDAYFVYLDKLIAFDHADRRIWAISIAPSSSSRQAWFDSISKQLVSIPSPDPRKSAVSPPRVPPNPHSIFAPDMSRSSYLQSIASCMDLISKGESYEVCLTTTFRHPTPATLHPLDLYKTLRRTNPAPYAAYLRPSADQFIACSSPERFMSVDPADAGDNKVVTMKPIKGTAKRGKTVEEDQRVCRALENSVKDRAENLMIVDLIRNDLNVIARPGKVRVPGLMRVETYETVHQMVSTIQADLHPSLSALSVLQHSFPPGSMTGAPKLRTVQLLESSHAGLEGPHAPRGVYSGSIGFLSVCGGAHFNVVIRTVTGTLGNSERQGEMTIGAGGAIVALSDPEEEWQEVLTKCGAAAGGVAAYLAQLSG